MLSKLAGRPALAVASGLLALTLVAPLWSTLMEAPQYRNEEALNVTVYAGRVKGDVGEIEVLNTYVGVHLPLDTPELKASPWVLGSLLFLSLALLAVPLPHRSRAALALSVLMLLICVAGSCLLQYRLYQMGHERSRAIMTGVPDFTPPLVGTSKIANFTVTMRLGLGAWCYAAAMLLLAWVA